MPPYLVTLSRQVESEFWWFPWPSSSRRLDLWLNRKVQWECSSLRPWCNLANVLVRGLPLFLAPPPIPNIIDFSQLFSLRMMCPKYDSCCFFINAYCGLVAWISSITDLLVLLAVHGILSSLLQHHNSNMSILILSAFLIVQDSQPYSTTGKTNAFTILHFVVIVLSLSFHILFSPVTAALPNANRLKSSPLQEPESSILAPMKTKSRTISTFSPSNSNSSISSVDMTLVFFRFK